MPQRISCRYFDHPYPPHASAFAKFWIGVCEQFGWPRCRQKIEFEILTDHPQIFLDKKVVFARQTSGGTYEASDKFTPINWSIGYDDKRGLIIDMTLRRLKLMPIIRALDNLSEDTLVISSIVAVEAVFVVVAFLVYAFLEFPSPAPFWNWVADNIRGYLTVLLPFTFGIGVDLLGKRLFSELYLRSRVVAFVLLFLSATMAGAVFVLWIVFCPVREPSQSYVDYLNALRAGSLASIFVNLSPWVALALKTVGLDFPGSVVTLTAQQAKEPGKHE